METSDAHSKEDYTFRLPSDFVAQYAKKTPPFGFNGLGEVTYRRSYSRMKEDGINEEWFETIERVVNGTYTMMHAAASKNEDSPWVEDKAVASAMTMYDKMFKMKFLPPGRGLYAMGTKITDTLRLYASLNNCSFVSTAVLHDGSKDRTRPFHFLMLMSMMGVGVGFDVKGKGAFPISSPFADPSTGEVYEDMGAHTIQIEIEDSREGWVSSTVALLRAYFYPGKLNPVFSYSNIRPKGTPLKRFGGIAPGPEPLRKLHDSLRKLLDEKAGSLIDTNLITDLMNLIGACVVAGGVRRTAEIALGDIDDRDFVHLKDFGTYRAGWMWTSNNSVSIGEDDNDFESIKKLLRVTLRTAANGEPGFYWMHNMQGYGRMDRVGDDSVRLLCYDERREPRATGTNPCAEQTLESYELCCLVETFPHLHESMEEYIQTLKYAYLYAKVVTTGMTQWPETNEIIQRNRRVGCSMTGVAQFVDHWGRKELANAIKNDPKKAREYSEEKVGDLIRKMGRAVLVEWCERGYRAIRNWDITYSKWMGISESVKVTSIKPSGTVSLLGGATPGMHWPIERYYKRRIRINDSSPLIPILKEAGYRIEKDTYADHTVVATFPVYCGSESIRRESEVTMEEQLSMAALLQKHWSDNQVSVTIKFWRSPTVQEASEFLAMVVGAYVNDREALKHIMGSRRVMDYSGEKGMQEALDTRWDKMDVRKIHEMLQGIGTEIGNINVGLSASSRTTLLKRYCLDMSQSDGKRQVEMMRGVIEHHIEMFFSRETEGDMERVCAERITDVLTVAKAAHIASLLHEYRNKLKAVSFLPMETGIYAQAPYERITETMYEAMKYGITPIKHWQAMPQPEQPIGCDGDACEKPPVTIGGTLAHSST